MKNIVILTGAGVSAESGIKTFRDADGLWEGHDVMAVASPQGWNDNPEMVLEFYNARHGQLDEVKPNAAHLALAKLDEVANTWIITQNVDDLHERAGSNQILHLHGELRKARSIKNPNLISTYPSQLKLGDLASDGAQLRPHIVWFGEAVPLLDEAVHLCSKADYILIIGTSMQVYPAASLINYAPPDSEKYYIDPKPAGGVNHIPNLEVLAENASTGVVRVVDQIISALSA